MQSLWLNGQTCSFNTALDEGVCVFEDLQHFLSPSLAEGLVCLNVMHFSKIMYITRP